MTISSGHCYEGQVKVDNTLNCFVGYDGVWIGATDLLHEGTYVYPSNGSKIRYSNWEGRQPGGGKKENCAVLALKSAVWHDYPCKHKFHYICVKH